MQQQPINNPINTLIYGVDIVAHQMEIKWGVGVLPQLVEQEIRDKFNRVVSKFNQAIETNDYDTIKTHGDNLIRGWKKLDELATQAGYDKNPTAFEVVDANGVTYYIVNSNLDAARLAAQKPAIASSIFLAQTIADLITNTYSVKPTVDSQNIVNRIHGSVSSQLDTILDDDIPF